MKIKLLGYTLEIHKKKARKRPAGYSAKRWTKSEINTMLKWHSEGQSTKDIADKLGRTAQAVSTRLYKIRKQK